MTVSRRTFIKGAVGTVVIPTLPGCLATTSGPFQHGVASGDPLSDRVILWTRLSPQLLPAISLDFDWRVATDANMTELVREGTGSSYAARDFTVKLDVDGLQPATTYYYQFSHAGWRSEIGRTKTLPLGQIEHLRIAFTSCSWFTQGYFNVYKAIAKRPDLDVVLHLGDYIYEYGALTQNPLLINRSHQPNHHIVTLQDYRTRHAQYKTDPDLKEAHRQHPFITVWDDHESADNSYHDGANNHDPETQGDWESRRAAAIQAYFEWMPIRETGLDENDDQLVYRNFRFGNLLNLTMLDTRLVGRDKQASLVDLTTINDPTRTLLGAQQEQWLFQQLSAAQQDNITWKVLGQQVMMGQLLAGTIAFNMDQWDGYPVARQRIYDHLKQNGISNFCVLTGDIHSSWANDLQEDPLAGSEILGVEFVTPAVTSFCIPVKPLADKLAQTVLQTMPHMHHVDLFHRGYVLMDITHERTQAEWHYVKSVDRPAGDYFARAFVTQAGNPGLVESFSETPAKASSVFAPVLSPLEKVI